MSILQEEEYGEPKEGLDPESVLRLL